MAYARELPIELTPVSDLEIANRARFIIRTYNHLLGAILAFAGIEVALFKTGAAETILRSMVGMPWMLVLGAFMIVGWLASAVAHRVTAKPLQYAALLAYVVAEALIFVPLLWYCEKHAKGVLQSAAIVTGAGFLGLTLVAFWIRKDFSFLGGFLSFLGVCAVVGIFASLIFGFTLGTWFSVGMIAFAGAAILYNTTAIMRYYPEDRYVAASLELFAAVVLLLWYVIRLFLRLRN
jgi:FtsH-binding integral membrane protein